MAGRRSAGEERGQALSLELALGASAPAVAVNTVVKGCILLFGGSQVAGRATFFWLMMTLVFGGAGLVVALLMF